MTTRSRVALDEHREACSKCGERARSGKNRWCSVCIGASRKRQTQTASRPANGANAPLPANVCALCAGKDATIATLTKRVSDLEGDATRLQAQVVDFQQDERLVTVADGRRPLTLPAKTTKPEPAPYINPYSARIYDRSLRA